MIHSVKCNKASFRTVEFQQGFNVILADRTKEASQKDSRNGLGKSTLIDIIHFCLGASKGEGLANQTLNDWTFTLDVDLGNKRYSVSRNTTNANKIIISGDSSFWPIKPERDKKTGQDTISARDWNRVLGSLLFGLQINSSDTKYVPTFRSLISYFVRRNGQRGGFLNPFQHYKAQLEWDKQVNNAYLLDLAWEYASKWQLLRDRAKLLTQIKEESRSGLLSNVLGTIGDLQAKKIRLETQIHQQEKDLKSFNVHPQYKDIEVQASQITSEIHEHLNANVRDQRLLDLYQGAIREESGAAISQVTAMYREAGVLFPQQVTKQIEDVVAFHGQVIHNRKSFIAAETSRLQSAIAERENLIQNLSSSRASLMTILEQHGALEEYTKLQNLHQKTVADFNDINIRLDNLSKFEKGKSALTVDKETLRQQARSDLDERASQRAAAIKLFNENSKVLYEAPGTFAIDLGDSGYKFDVTIERSGSHGIGNMKIFCYDLLLAQLWANRPLSPGFLIHDSTLFADVDERQKALAIQLASEQASKGAFQYICMMNSDAVPRKDLDRNFNFDSQIRLTLTDATDDGGLLGIRF